MVALREHGGTATQIQQVPDEACLVFSGTLVHSTKENMMEICKKRLIGVDNKGKVTVSLFRLEFYVCEIAQLVKN